MIFLAPELSAAVIIMQINVGILTFMSMVNLILSWAEHGKSFITWGPVWILDQDRQSVGSDLDTD